MRSTLHIKTELERLVGLTVWGPSFAADMLTVQFGATHQKQNRQGQQYLVGDLAVHIQAPWRLTEQERILVGSADLQRSNNPASVLELINQAISSNPKVVSVAGVRAGGFLLALENAVHLEVFPDHGPATDCEFWRMLSPTASSPHFVVGAADAE